MGRKLAVAFSPVVPSEPGAAEVAFAIIDDAVLAGTASSKIEKVISAVPDVFSKLNDELGKRGLLADVVMVAQKGEDYSALLKGCESFSELHALLSGAEDILATVTASLPSAPSFTSLSAAATAVGSTVLLPSGGMSASAVAVMTIVSVLRTLARKAALTTRPDPSTASNPSAETARPSAGVQPDTTVLLLRGFAPTATQIEVTEFLSPFTAKLLFFSRDALGRPTGDVFAEFSSVTDAKAAMSRHKERFGGRIIEVFPSTLSELRVAITAPTPTTRDASGPAPTDCVLRMRGLPFSATPRDVIEFFSDVPLQENQVHFGVAFDGRSTGEGYVELRSDADLKRCMAHDRQKMQSRYIELFPSTRSDMEAATRRGGGRDREPIRAAAPAPTPAYPPSSSYATLASTGAASTPGDSVFVRLRGLPFSASQQDIVDFFTGVTFSAPVTVSDVYIQRNADGRVSGEAFVRLSSRGDIASAMTKQRSLMGRRYIEVFEASPTDIRHLQEFIASTQGSSRASAYGSTYSGYSGYPAASVPAPAAAYSSQKGAYSSGYGDARSTGYTQGYGSASYGVPPTHTGYSTGREYAAYQQSYAGETASSVIVRGLAYGITQRDIAGLFRDYRVAPEDVYLYMGPDGRTPQQAAVRMRSVADVQSAVHYLNGAGLLGTRVELYMAPPTQW